MILPGFLFFALLFAVLAWVFKDHRGDLTLVSLCALILAVLTGFQSSMPWNGR